MKQHKQQKNGLLLLLFVKSVKSAPQRGQHPGLGTPVNLDTAYAYFVTAASHNDPLGHNGLGYIYFRGTNAQVRDDQMRG